MSLNATYWNERYEQGNFPWDLGKPSRPLVEICQELTDLNTRIMIPGAGSAWEAQWLHERGFREVTVVDWAEEPLERLRKRMPDFPEEGLVRSDFFAHEGTYDLILEQTFFCALPPALRPRYAEKMHEILAPGGRLAGVLFSFPFIEEKGPPWGGSEQEYRERFAPWFTIEEMRPCEISEPPRQGSELIFSLRKPQ